MCVRRNPVCNNRSRFLLLTHKSRFVDFQKVRIQEVQAELPRGCIPRSLEVILRAESVESAQAGDRYGTWTFKASTNSRVADQDLFRWIRKTLTGSGS